VTHRSQYKILGESGRGGLGVVHKARHDDYDRFVALKEIQSNLKDEDESRRRFLREIDIASQLSHPLIVNTRLDHDTREMFYVMEYIKGLTFAEIMDGKIVLSEKQTLFYGIKIATALAYMHSKNILHMDVKPDNVFYIRSGKMKLFDFSLSTFVGAEPIAKPGIFLGSVGYVAPETITQDRGPAVADDIYSLGATLFALATGCEPFGNFGDCLDCLTAQIKLDPRRPDALNPELSSEFGDVITTMREREENDRYQSMTEVLAALRAIPVKEKV
jgi:serine/threonine protein kinase